MLCTPAGERSSPLHAYAGASPYAITCREQGKSPVTYNYILNLQGDVVALAERSGKVVATYEYDPFGNPLFIWDGSGNSVSGDPSHIANRNPLRYRGYYYDRETGFYYLQSRYYDPAICRFINSDAYASTGNGFIGNNMFAYCDNDPINFADFEGTNKWWIMAITHDWGLVHRNVVNQIKLENNKISTEVTVDWNGGGYGRMDVYDPETRTVWEVKSSGAGAAKASKQALGYVGSTLRSNHNEEVKCLGMAGRFTGSFSFEYYLGPTVYTIQVTYQTPEMGVILYDFNILQGQMQPVSVPQSMTISEQERAAKARATRAVVGIGVAGALALGGGFVIGGSTNLCFGWGGINVQQPR